MAASFLFVGCGDPDVGTDGGGAPTCVETDIPDSDGIDANCDGIDGLLADSVFVDGLSGGDGNNGSRSAPVATITRGIALAVEQDKHAVVISRAIYQEQVTIADGVSIHGGYDASAGWSRAPLTTLTTIVQPSASPALDANAITTDTSVTGLRIVASDASVSGGSSIATRVRSSDAITFAHVTMIAGDGAAGTSPAAPNTSTPGFTGNTGSPSRCQSGAGCSDSPIIDPVAGAPAASCGCGAGGAGGGAQAYVPGAGEGGERYQADGVTCERALTGTSSSEGARNTSVTNGLAGNPGATGATGNPGGAGTIIAGFLESGYVPAIGTTGTAGRTGGGGGGGAGSYFVACDAEESVLWGSGGGGGGSGGCGGAGGAGGHGGGASIALYTWASSPTLIEVTLETANGGQGGTGASGGMGGMGGLGGARGPGTTCSAGSSYRGGRGGDGGAGGTGGAGGSGAGGSSIAIVLGGGSSLHEDSRDYFSRIGEGGTGGGAGTPNAAASGLSCVLFDVALASCVAP